MTLHESFIYTRSFNTLFNSLAPERFQFNLSYVIVKLTLVNGGWGIFNEIAHWWMPLDLTDDNSTLVQVMAWCRQATSHYLIQCWPRSLSPNGVTRPQWVKVTMKKIFGHHGYKNQLLTLRIFPANYQYANIVPYLPMPSPSTVLNELTQWPQPWWVNSLWPSDAIWWHRSGQHWLRQWLIAGRHQAITWTNGQFYLMGFCGIHLRAISQWVQ